MINDLVLARQIRHFNRRYTNLLGLLDRHLLGSSQSLTEVRILFEIKNAQDCSPSDLKQVLQIDKGYLSRLILKLEKLGFLNRTVSEKDKRRQILRLSAKGKAFVEEMAKRSDQQILGIVQTLSADQKEKLSDYIARIETLLIEREPDPSKIQVRHCLRSGDIGKIISMHGKLYSEEFGYGLSFESSVAKTFFEFVQSYDPHADRIWILEYSGEIIGTIAVAAKGQNALLRWFLLDPSFRGLGLGKKLLTEAIDYCREKGYQEVLLGTAGDLLSALALYKKFGFEIIAQSENHEWRDHVTEIEMRLKLK